VVGDCCYNHLDHLYTSGIYLTRDYGLPVANSADDARLDKIKELAKQYAAAEQAAPS
jgi:hypothetical protein